MERSKSILGKKPVKGKAVPPGDLFALGSKSSRQGESSLQKPGSVGIEKKPSSFSDNLAALSVDRKRESSLLGPGVAKKPKLLSAGQTFTPLGKASEREAERRLSPVPPISTAYEESAIEVENTDLLSEIGSADESNEIDRLEGLLCGAVKHLHQNRSKPDPIVFLTLMHLAKSKPNIFNRELVIEAFCTLLRRDMSLNFKSKGNLIVSVLVCNVLMQAYVEESNWPEDFVKVYIDDALGERVWVDRADCKGFVDNIVTAFNTNMPKANLAMLDVKQESGSASPAVSFSEDDDSRMEVDSDKYSAAPSTSPSVPVSPRYPNQFDNIESFVMDIIRDQLLKRQLMDASSKNLIRLMTVTCGYQEVRQLASQKLELWLQNPKLARASQDLLMSVCMNCDSPQLGDQEVVAMLLKIRLKTKPVINHYLLCIRELLLQHAENLRSVLTHTIYNELSTARNPNNMPLIAIIFQTQTDTAARILAEIFQDLLTNKDDYLRALRALLREIVRSLRHDFHCTTFCLALMQLRTESKFTDMEPVFKERYLVSVTDLVTMCALQAVTPAVREASTALTRGDRKDVDVLYAYQQLVATIQRDAIWWLHTIVPSFMEPKQQDYVHCIRKVLFLESGDNYAKDGWPAEADRGPMIRLAQDCPVLEDTLMRILVIGLSRDFALGPPDAVELADILIRRAASLQYEGRQVLHVARLELFDALLNLCSYRHPENIVLPSGYQAPQLAISSLYWKAWIILLTISAFNPATFGLSAWENYPTLKCLIEMVMTNNYKFPPPTTAADDSSIEEIRSNEIQVSQREKQQILEFEGHLAASTTKVTITEGNSLLIAQLTAMDPNGPARKPPQQVLDQLRVLNESLKIGQMLCRSRNPDFLLDIIQRQGTSQSMPWLAELVETAEGSMDVLPVQCLCEFLLHDSHGPHNIANTANDEEPIKFEKHKKKQKLRKQQQFLRRLQWLVHEGGANSSTMQEVMDYFLKRLASMQAASRALAVKGLSLIISKSELSPSEESLCEITDEEPAHSWLLKQLPSLPMFPSVKEKICLALRQAIQIECDCSLVSVYVIFLSKHSDGLALQNLDSLALDIAHLVVERTLVMQHMLPQDSDTMELTAGLETLEAFLNIYLNYIHKAREPNSAGYTWSNTQDQIMLQWDTGETATMHILVVHAIVIILSYGPALDKKLFQELLAVWFPANGKMPTAYLLDTSEEALLLPDLLKLRMLRSNVKQLIDAVLEDIEPKQLLLFFQSFGIPVGSMSRLLQRLDQAVSTHTAAIEQFVGNHAFMMQYIEVQRNRGAQGGDQFYALLTGGKMLKDLTGKPDVEMACSDSPLWPVHRPQGKAVQPISGSHVANMLLQAFDTSGSNSTGAETNLQALKQALLKSNQGVFNIITGLNEILSSSSAAIQSFLSSSKFCSFLALVISRQSVAGVQPVLTAVLDRLARLGEGQPTPILVMLHQYSRISRAQSTMKVNLSSSAQFGIDVMKLPLDSTQQEKQILKSMMSSMMSSRITEHRPVELAASALLAHQSTTDGNILLPSTAALFIDWLELLDPEVIRAVPEVQEKLVFCQKVVEEGCAAREAHICQPYLLSLLTHQTSWASLHTCITALLAEHSRQYDPTLVLDFLWACIHIPKLWQGREKRIAKNASKEDVLGLSASQLSVLVSYVVQEASYCLSANRNLSPKHRPTNQIPVAVKSRMELLTSCICDDDDKMKVIVHDMEDGIDSDSEKCQVYETLLLELYVQYPYLLAWVSKHRLTNTDQLLTTDTLTQMDMITHRLITGLYPGRMTDKMADVEVACRKLAAHHPLLVLRQLPALAALLKGKSQFSFAQFRQQGLLSLSECVLSILQLLAPAIFKQHAALNDILTEFFNVLQAYSNVHIKKIGPFAAKLVLFLDQYVNCDSIRATSVLQRHVQLLINISSSMPEQSTLKSLLAGLSLPWQGEHTAEGSSMDSPMLPRQPPSPGMSSSHLGPFIQRLRRDNPDDVMATLQDLAAASSQNQEVLQHFVEDLKRLMMSPHDQCRHAAFDLTKTCLKHSPKLAADFVAAFLHCLEHAEQGVVMSALTNLAEFTLLCQDFSDIILQKAFTAGVSSSLDTGPFIRDCLQMLNLDLYS